MPEYILAIDQGTTSSRAIVFDGAQTPVAVAQEEFEQHFPQSGWVEHEVEDIWQTTVSTCRDAIAKAGIGAADIAAIGITNQRETTVIWDRETGEPLHRAIVWQDRRTAEMCQELKAGGNEVMASARTGLLLDPYFSGTKAAWVLDKVDGARAAAEAGKLAFGTIDCFLLWRLSGSKIHATDATNASRTLLYDIHEGCWSQEMCDLIRVPMSMLPEVKNSADDYGVTDPDLFGGPIAVCGIAGDQQAATIGQACFKPGMMKSTYGTGCFAVLNTGVTPVASTNRLLTTIAYQLNGKPTYALEGSIFIAGAAVQWLRDGLKVIDNAAQSGELAQQADDNQEVFLVPAFVGMGAPYWDAEARGALYGITRGTGPEELARAALESVGFQTRDLLEAMKGDWSGAGSDTVLRVDGGMTASDWTMQFLSDILGAPVDRPQVQETTALGAAYLAGMHAGVYPDLEGFAKTWALEQRFLPELDAGKREQRYSGWKDAVRRTLSDT
ncbi:MAG: glycerol kinase GlpK [Rhodospirillaceae bacterium]|jgi:glycerol kinase|nr:glycerol kinase GlpK [Rhodospirillaceae bacterium]MBT5245720.1 glycerol kinase GlpK [Rhodospirillaceae bacterium]MBT5562384.1 glycerol kinase GlpK [Rhodospirillaceae bacterium]MBT6242910.1 glycerol kinase GlpK [Rhodospirillaceae bacterium]MBT7138455.1 glycerol kinase GlpK [Rhodospirillaceae bacterium]